MRASCLSVRGPSIVGTYFISLVHFLSTAYSDEVCGGASLCIPFSLVHQHVHCPMIFSARAVT